MKQLERLSPVARRAWKRLASEFPLWIAHLNTRDGELEFAVPAPSGSTAGHLVAFSHENQLWVRFSPPHLCYPTDDEGEMVSVIKQLTADNVVFRLVMKGDEWVETSLTKPKKKLSPDLVIRFDSSHGRAGTTERCRKQAFTHTIRIALESSCVQKHVGLAFRKLAHYRRLPG